MAANASAAEKIKWFEAADLPIPLSLKRELQAEKQGEDKSIIPDTTPNN